MGIEIRRASAEDLELLVQWRMEVLREVFSIPDGQPLDRLEEENRSYYKEALGTGGHIACFASVDGEEAGCGGICVYREMPSPDNPDGRCAYLMNIYTRPKFRKMGVGETVVKWLTDQAERRGISKVYLETSDAGKSLYTKLGFVPMEGMLRLRDKVTER